jgi:Domain of unknown function (DUF4398)
MLQPDYETCSLSDLRRPMLRSRQKPRFLPAATKLLSEKRPQALFFQIDQGSTMLLRSGLIPAAALLCGFACGCATQGPQPSEEMTRARTLVDQADRSGAQRYAAADLQRAHDELANADKAVADKKYDDARRYAESAAADADVASARASDGDAQRAAHEVRQSNDTLRQEANAGTPATTPN